MRPFSQWPSLAGHCFSGDLAKPGQTDTHCFSWVYAGKFLRDVHTVRTPGKPDLVGESTYYYDFASKTLRYLYVEDSGGIGRGSVESAPGALVFPDSEYAMGGEPMKLRVRWTLEGETAYEAVSEVQKKDGTWVPLFKAWLKRVEK